MKPIALSAILLAVFVCTEIHAAAFRNLNFEEANTSTVRPGFNPGELFGPTSDLAPGWQIFRGSTQLTSIGFKLTSPSFMGDGGVSLISSPHLFGPPIEGNFSLTLNVPSLFIDPRPLSLSQRGDIPGWAQFLVYTYKDLPFIPSINGMDLLLANQNPGFPTTVFADVSMFAGSNVELGFRPGQDLFGTRVGPHTLDSITFVVPEPSTYAVFILGGIMAVLRWLRLQRRLQT